MEENNLNRNLIYYNPHVNNDTRLEMYIYSLEDQLLGMSSNVSNWTIDSLTEEEVLNRIDEIEKIISEQQYYRFELERLEGIINNENSTQVEKSNARNELENINSLIIPFDDLTVLIDERRVFKESGVSHRIKIDIHNNFRRKNFKSGIYKVTYKFLKDLVKNCVIDTISSDRKSARIKLKSLRNTNDLKDLNDFFGLIDYNKEPLYENTNFYMEPSVTFFKEEHHRVINWVPVNDHTVLLKFYNPLPNDIEENSDLKIILPLSEKINDKVILYPAPSSVEVNILSPSTYNIRNNFKKKEMKLSSHNDIVSNDYDLSTKLLNKYFGKTTEGIELNVDYRKFDNFIFYSSAYYRLEVFKYKLQLIENYDDSIRSLESTITGSASSSLAFLNNITKYKNLRDDIINKLDDYEQYLYFESSSYESSSLGEYYPTTWPKTTKYKPHTLYHSTSSEAETWYDGITDSASIYDNTNRNALVRTIPEHIREDGLSDNYETFVNMVAHQLDTLWLYTKHLEYLKDRDESLYSGISKDLVYSVLSSYGWDGVNDMQYDDLWYYTYGTNESGSAILTGSLAPSQSLEWITAVSESISSGDLQKEVWKRILNNLPYLNKTKGTKEGIRALINCYGIPSTELRIKEFGGPEPLNNKSYYEYRKFTLALQIEPDNQINVPAPYTNGSIEFRFKTDYEQLPMVILQDANTGSSVQVAIDSNGSMSVYTPNEDIHLNSIPVNDGKWWSFGMIHNTGNTYDVHLRRTEYSRITHHYSSSVDTGPIPYQEERYYIGSGSQGIFSGSIQEFRLWDTSLNDDTLDNHALAPTAYHGNTETASFDHLLFRLTLGTDTKKYNHFLTSSLNSQHPNWRIPASASFVDFPNKYNYEALEETYNQEWPDLSANRTISNKVRVETNEITGALYVDRRTEVSSFDEYPLDNAKVGVYLSTTNEVDQDIAEFMGGFRIDDYIGSYENYYTNDYPELRDLRNKYFSQYTGRYNTMDYFRLLNYFNTSVFKQIKEILPGRSKPLTGLVVEPHILNRNKVSILYQKPTVENTTKEVEIDTQDKIVFSNEMVLYEPNFAFHKTGSSQYYWHDIIYVTGSPVRVENDSYFQEAKQKFYEYPREYDNNVLKYLPASSGSPAEVVSSSIYSMSIETRWKLPRSYKYTPLGVKNHRYLGSKIQSNDWNVPSADLPDHSPVVEFTETSELIMRTQNPNELGNLIVG